MPGEWEGSRDARRVRADPRILMDGERERGAWVSYSKLLAEIGAGTLCRVPARRRTAMSCTHAFSDKYHLRRLCDFVLPPSGTGRENERVGRRNSTLPSSQRRCILP